MIKVFDYIFYRVYCLYKYKWNESHPKHYTVGVISVLQQFNLLLLFFFGILFLGLIELKPYFKGIALVLFFSLYGINFYRYTDSKISNLEVKFEKDDNIKRKKKGWLIIIYIIFTMVISVFLFAKLGKNIGMLAR